jgi:hypothetical protein
MQCEVMNKYVNIIWQHGFNVALPHGLVLLGISEFMDIPTRPFPPQFFNALLQGFPTFFTSFELQLKQRKKRDQSKL